MRFIDVEYESVVLMDLEMDDDSCLELLVQ